MILLVIEIESCVDPGGDAVVAYRKDGEEDNRMHDRASESLGFSACGFR